MVPNFKNKYVDDGDLFALKWGREEYVSDFPKVSRNEDDT